MIDIEVRHLRLITAIVDTGTVTNAANQLNLTQSALSHQLRYIEERLGTPLFQRHSRRMVLTPAGERLLDSARSVLEELMRAEEDIRKKAAQREGVLRLSTECYTCYHWLPARLKEFNRKYPRVEVRIVASATRQPIPALLDGKLDLAAVSTRVRNQKLVYKPIFKDEVIVLTHPEHPLASRLHIKPEDFATEHLIAYNAPKESLLIFQKVLGPAGVAPRELTQVDLTEAILEMVRAGIGITTMARWAARPYLESGAVKGVRLTRKGLYRTWSAVTLRSNSTPRYLTDFVNMLAARGSGGLDLI